MKLRSLGYTPYTGPLALQDGLLNDNRLITNDTGELFCFRLKKYGYRDLVVAYLRGLYGAMGVDDRRARLRFRTIKEQVDFTDRCHVCALNVPVVVAFDTDWMITRYIPGVRLKDYLAEHEGLVAATNFLDDLSRAHMNDIVFFDRWGGNELVTGQDTIVFLDFDIELQFDGPNASRYAATLDLAVALRTCLLWSQIKGQTLDLLSAWLENLSPGSAELYDQALLARFLGGACDFYNSPARTAALATSAPLSQHHATNECVYRLMSRLSSEVRE